MAEERKSGGQEQLTWRRIALGLIAVMVFCLAASVYGLAPRDTFLWRPLADLTPFGPDELEVMEEGEAKTYTGIITIVREMQEPAPAEEPEKKEGEEEAEPELIVIERVTITLGSGEQKSWLMTDLEWVKVRHVPIRPVLFVSAVLFLVGFFFLARKTWSRLAWRLPGQGRWVRISGYLVVIALAIFGYEAWYETEFLGIEMGFRNILFPTVGVVLLGLLIAHLLLNKPKWAEFQIETEGELKKVSWPSRREYVGSSIIVIVVSVVMASFLYAADVALSFLVGKLGGF
ncbi:MAG: preprotein translocase subunit SecE [Planctomycetota bacterium]|jgi:preprotein translocase subunit SecE